MTKTIHKANLQRSAPTQVPTSDPIATVTLTSKHGCDSAWPSHHQPTDAREEVIRGIAHRKWEPAGCLAGDGFDFWLKAEREVNAEGTAE